MANYRVSADYCHSKAIHAVASLSSTLQFISDLCFPYDIVDVVASNARLLHKRLNYAPVSGQ